MMWIHPIIMALTGLLSFYVLYLGWVRFRMAHLKHKGVMFQWKRHVHAGTAVHALWVLGVVNGVYFAWHEWASVGLTGEHYVWALIMIPVALAGYLTGLVMDRVKKKRTRLPLLHGLINLILVGIGLHQGWTGYTVLRDMVIG